MTGDKYQIFYSVAGGTVLHDTVDRWKEAKAIRGNVFAQKREVRAAWVMRTNPSLGLRSEKFGFTLRRTKHETAA